MTLEQIILSGKGYAGHHRAWRTHPSTWHGEGFTELWHYSTLMAVYRLESREFVYIGLGHGSVSDQGGMNKAFRTLGTPYYYSRAGGAQVTDMFTSERVDSERPVTV